MATPLRNFSKAKFFFVGAVEKEAWAGKQKGRNERSERLAGGWRGGKGKVFEKEERISGRRDSNSSIPKRPLIASANLDRGG